ncbi:MAG TPA: hypothetical protein VIL28_02720 [Steroidobacteraceae bacterium]
MFKRLRILILLLILLFVALNTYFDRVYTTDWDRPLYVTLFPINGDGSPTSERYIAASANADFSTLESFFERQARRYGVELEHPVRFARGPQIREIPPMLAPDTGLLGTMWWSLRTRYWAWRVADHGDAPKPDIELFVLYYDPATSPALPHSVGLQKGLFGIVHAFADRTMEGSNDIVIAHELLHTLGAIDKYAPGTNQPLDPIGLADPEREPLYPQTYAELMAGRIAISEASSEIPESLHEVVIGPLTASEIGWMRN